MKNITIKQLMNLIRWNTIKLGNDSIKVRKEDKQKLEDFQNFTLSLDYIIDKEYESFQENCECDIDVSVDNYEDCKCKANEWHPYLLAQKSYNVYFNN